MSAFPDGFNPEVDRYDQRSAARLFEWLWPTAEVSQACAQALAASIRVAHEASDACWEVSMFPQAIRLNVGQVEVLMLKADEARFLIHAPLDLEDASPGDVEIGSDPCYPAVPVPSGVCTIATDDLASLPFAVREAHDAYIHAAASFKRRSPFWKSFSPAVLEYLEDLLSVSLPRPTYLGRQAGIHGVEAPDVVAADALVPHSGRPAPRFGIGRIYNRRAEIHHLYGGQRYGGISTPAGGQCIFLFTGDSGMQHGYRDGWSEDGVFLYTGEGQSGDMQFIKGNLAIRDHVTDGRDLHLFESLGKGEGYRYHGQFDCVGWEWRSAPDSAGHERQVIVFHLLPEQEVEDGDQERDSSTKEDGTSLQELRRRALAAVPTPGEQPPREASRLYYERSAAVKAYVLARAAGICEVCREPAPFRRLDGTLYLEPHHTRRIADGGPDHPRWVGAICPNCHKEIHHGQSGDMLNGRLEAYLASVEAE